MILPEVVLQPHSMASCSLNLGKDRQSLVMEHKSQMGLRRKEVKWTRLPLVVGGEPSACMSARNVEMDDLR